jgi:polyisoprenoid-binding protein YceI
MATVGRHEIGPGNGTLILHTSRQGLAAQVGHDLTIEVMDWSGVVTIADDPAASGMEITVRTGSLRVLEGTGGIKPLSERDKREILGNARKILKSDRLPEATFTATAVTITTSGDGSAEGMLTLLDTARPVRLEITALGGLRYRATGTVVQSDYGIKPYTALLGALKLADPVGVEAEVDLAGDA